MKPPILARQAETKALRGDLRACELSPQPIPCPENRPTARNGGRR
jgi:hypothetical protein